MTVFRNVLGRARNVLVDAGNVFGDACNALGGAGNVLRGVCLVLGTTAVASAQTPSGGALAGALREAGARKSPVWISYPVPMIAGQRRLCFDQITTRRGGEDDLHLALPPSSEMVVYTRVNGTRIERIRTFTPDCPVDAGSTPIVRAQGVTAAESAAWLGAVAAAPDADVNRVVEPALLALSLDDDPVALTKLISIARDDARTRVRGQALFWLADRAGERVMATIAGAIDNDPDLEVKKKAVFALSQMPRDEGVPKLIEVARTNRNPAVRKQAIFWLGQSNDARAITFLEEILRGK
jgi:HEAT repeats